MGAHFNPISLSIVNSESAAAIESSWDASVRGLYSILKNCRLCDSAECGFCRGAVSGCESNWRYTKRDTVGSAGANMGMSLEVFAPSLIKCVGDTSGKHADKILCQKTGVHEFDTVPVITAEMWKAVQDYNMLRIRLAYVEYSQAFHIQWQHEADFFTSEGKG
jgi:hypothetical protein